MEYRFNTKNQAVEKFGDWLYQAVNERFGDEGWFLTPYHFHGAHRHYGCDGFAVVASIEFDDKYHHKVFGIFRRLENGDALIDDYNIWSGDDRDLRKNK